MLLAATTVKTVNFAFWSLILIPLAYLYHQRSHHFIIYRRVPKLSYAVVGCFMFSLFLGVIRGWFELSFSESRLEKLDFEIFNAIVPAMPFLGSALIIFRTYVLTHQWNLQTIHLKNVTDMTTTHNSGTATIEPQIELRLCGKGGANGNNSSEPYKIGLYRPVFIAIVLGTLLVALGRLIFIPIMSAVWCALIICAFIVVWRARHVKDSLRSNRELWACVASVAVHMIAYNSFSNSSDNPWFGLIGHGCAISQSVFTFAYPMWLKWQCDRAELKAFTQREPSVSTYADSMADNNTNNNGNKPNKPLELINVHSSEVFSVSSKDATMDIAVWDRIEDDLVKNNVSLRKFLRRIEGYQFFAAYCASCFALENLLFLAHISTFLSIVDTAYDQITADRESQIIYAQSTPTTDAIIVTNDNIRPRLEMAASGSGSGSSKDLTNAVAPNSPVSVRVRPRKRTEIGCANIAKKLSFHYLTDIRASYRSEAGLTPTDRYSIEGIQRIAKSIYDTFVSDNGSPLEINVSSATRMRIKLQFDTRFRERFLTNHNKTELEMGLSAVLHMQCSDMSSDERLQLLEFYSTIFDDAIHEIWKLVQSMYLFEFKRWAKKELLAKKQERREAIAQSGLCYKCSSFCN